jgi:hypothetical protein
LGTGKNKMGRKEKSMQGTLQIYEKGGTQKGSSY